MFLLHIQHPELGQSRAKIERFPFRIGRHADNDLVLTGWRVARLHAELHAPPIERLRKDASVVQSDDGNAIRLKDRGSLGGTWVNGARVQAEQLVGAADEIVIAGFTLRIERLRRGAATSLASIADDLELVVPTHASQTQADPTQTDPTQADPALGPAPGATPSAADRNGLVPGADAAWIELRRSLHRRLHTAIDLRRNDVGQWSDRELRTEMERILRELIAQDQTPLSGSQRESLVRETLDEAVGLGPLEALLVDSEITEIMVNGPSEIFVERHGKLRRIEAKFSSEQAVRAVIERIVAPLGRRIDESAPMVDARLPDGARVNAVLPPLALRGPVITIRKFSRRVLCGDDLLALGSLNEPMLAFLKVCIATRRNIAISGGTGAGKTSLLNVLASLIPARERIITIEDAAELNLPHDNQVALEARQANAEGRGAIVIRDLVRNALRMRPDRIVVGECRGGETLDMLQAMNTGHDGSMTTLHANSARDVCSRLETMALMAGIDLPVLALREQIAGAIDIIVHQARLPDGSRKIVDISEVTGMESARVQMQSLFRYAVSGDAGHHRPESSNRPLAQGFTASGLIPQFYESLAAQGHVFDLAPFQPPRIG